MVSTTRVQKLRLGFTSRSRLKLRSKESLRPPSISRSGAEGLIVSLGRLAAVAGKIRNNASRIISPATGSFQ